MSIDPLLLNFYLLVNRRTTRAITEHHPSLLTNINSMNPTPIGINTNAPNHVSTIQLNPPNHGTCHRNQTGHCTIVIVVCSYNRSHNAARSQLNKHTRDTMNNNDIAVHCSTTSTVLMNVK
jgi:hypothetical protein